MPKAAADSFHARLTTLMAEAGLSDADLAEKVGTSRQHVWRLRTGKRKPYWDTICAVADAMNVGLDEFRGKKSGKKVVQPT